MPQWWLELKTCLHKSFLISSSVRALQARPKYLRAWSPSTPPVRWTGSRQSASAYPRSSLASSAARLSVNHYSIVARRELYQDGASSTAKRQAMHPKIGRARVTGLGGWRRKRSGEGDRATAQRSEQSGNSNANRILNIRNDPKLYRNLVCRNPSSESVEARPAGRSRAATRRTEPILGAPPRWRG